jgi:hypothetical protein
MLRSLRSAQGRIFISYRREETAYHADWLYDFLAGRFGRQQVFKDVDSILPGEDFVEKITKAVEDCDVLLALVGDRWLAIADTEGNRRLNDPKDFVRLEIEAALEGGVRVIPVLFEGARIPRAEELPKSMGQFVRCQAQWLSSTHFKADADKLLSVLKKVLPEERARREAETKARREAETKARREAETKARREAETKARREAETKARREAEVLGESGLPEHWIEARRTVHGLPADIEADLSDPISSVRVRAIKSIEGLLNGSDPAVAMQARSALERLAQGDDSRSVVRAARMALERHGQKELPDYLQKFLTNPSPMSRIMGLQGLEKLLDGDDEVLAMQARSALERIAQEDDSKSVKDRARRALRRPSGR